MHLSLVLFGIRFLELTLAPVEVEPDPRGFPMLPMLPPALPCEDECCNPGKDAAAAKPPLGFTMPSKES